MYSRESKSEWRQHNAVIILALVVFPPVGLAFAYLSNWPHDRKIRGMVLSVVWLLLVVVVAAVVTGPEIGKNAVNPPEVPNFVGKSLEDAATGATQSGYTNVSHDASPGDETQIVRSNWQVCFQVANGKNLDFGVVRVGVPCPASDGGPIPWPKVPDVTQKTFAEAAQILRSVGIKNVSATGAYTDNQPTGNMDSWIVCSHDPAAGQDVNGIYGNYSSVRVTQPGVECPSSEYVRLNPLPGGTEDDGTSENGSSSPKPDSESFYYKNCDAVRDAGKAPLYRGDAGYRAKLDRNKDGVACE